MSEQNKQIILFALLALFIYGVWSYYFTKEKNNTDKPFTKGYSVEKIEMRMTNDAGELTAKFTSPNLIRYTDSPILYIESPIVWTYANNSQDWLLTANKAELNTKTNKVKLQENVNAHTLAKDKKITLIAQSLELDITSKKAHTTEGISLQKEQMTMDAVVAHIDLETKIIEVKNNVKTIYNPNK